MKKILSLGFLILINSTAFSQTTEELEKQVYKHYEEGDIVKTITAVEKLLEKIKEQAGEETANYILWLKNLGHLNRKINLTDNARTNYEQALELQRKINVEKNADYAETLNFLAILYHEQGKYDSAAPLYLQSLELYKEVKGRESPEYATVARDLAGVYRQKAQYEKAEPLYLEAVEIRKKLSGENSEEYASSLDRLAQLYSAMSEYAKAEPLYLEAKNIMKIVLGEKHPDYASVLNNLAALYFRMGHYSKAEPLYKEVLEIKERAGDNSSGYAINCNNLAELYKTMGEFLKAERLSIRALDIQRNILGEAHPDYLFTLNNLANLYEKMGAFEKAESMYLSSLELRKTALGENHPEYASNLNDLGGFYETMGEYLKSESYYLKAIEVMKAGLRESHPDFAGILNNLGHLYKQLGNYSKAEPLYLKANEIRKLKLGENHKDFASSQNNLGGLYKEIGQYKKAETYYQQALKIFRNNFGPDHFDCAIVLNNLGILYETVGDKEEAIRYQLESLSIRKKIYGEEHPSYATALHSLAGAYEKKGDYTKADSFFIKAADIREKVLGKMHPLYASTLNYRAVLYTRQGAYQKALPLHLQATEIRREQLGETHPDYASSLQSLGLLYGNLNEFSKAESLLVKADKIDNANLLSTFDILSENEKNILVANRQYKNEILNSFLYLHSGLDSLSENNFNTQLSYKSVSLEDTKKRLNAIRNSRDTSLKKLLSLWMNSKQLLARQLALPVNKRIPELDSIKLREEELEKELARRSASFTSQNSLRITMKDVSAALKPDEAVVEFVRFHLKNNKWTDSIIYAAYVLRKTDAVPVFVPLCEEKQLQTLFDSAGTSTSSMVGSFYRGLGLKNKNAASLGMKLFKLVWEPLEPYLKNITKIAYSPAGKLYSIAFHALPADSNSVLMDKYELRQYTSSRQVALGDLEYRKGKPDNIVLFGNASFTMDSLQLVKQKTNLPGKEKASSSVYRPKKRSSDNNTWSNLPGTGAEVNRIKQLFEQNRIVAKSFVQTAASEENLKSLNGNSPQILHIATHGFFLPEAGKNKTEREIDTGNAYTLADDPLLRSGLILSGANYAWSGKTVPDGVEDGIATAYEISQLNLSNTELVVLSACETALGDVKGSEGVFGLQRAFKMAGVKKMIVSLWQVPDKETAELMTGFYSYWMKGKNVHESFAQAQADMRKKYSPFYWAAFVLVE